MSNFAVKLLESVNNNGKLKFYKLLKDGVAQIDLFYDEVCKDNKHKKSMLRILTMMDYVAETDAILPKEKVNVIKEGDKVIGIEFKKDDLRVYCVKQKPNVIVVMGGYKKKQDKDIDGFKRVIKEAGDFLNDLNEEE